MKSTTTTALTYLDDPYQLTLSATVLDIETREDGLVSLILDQTVFYPQGGGQPYDLGVISTADATFEVQQVRFTPDGFVHHIGASSDGFKAGDAVELQVDEERRMLHCRLHTAGHLVDVAMIKAGFDFEPSKGYHFADSPYVEYKGSIDAEDRPAAIERLNSELGALIDANAVVKWRTVLDKEALTEDCKFIPDYLPEGKPIRVVTVSGLGCPCGGTHVKTNGEIGRVTVKKIKVKSGNTRVSYQLNAD
jgi:Ser-tRNA(Ala) deacylase AlaX